MLSLFLTVLLTLLFLHALADYPLQGDFLAKAKNRHAPIPGVPWWQAMFAHTMIHAGFVFMATGSIALALAEMVVHWVVDDNKCSGQLSFNQDQAIHVLCKVFWAVAFVASATAGVPLP